MLPSNNYKKILSHIHFPTLFILLGSVFIFSNYHKETTFYLKSYIALWGILLYSLIKIICYLQKNKFDKTNNVNILYTIFLVGILECIVVFIQLVFNYNGLYLFIGSFGNPSIVSMYLSFCIPIGIWLNTKRLKKKNRLHLCAIVMGMCFIILISGSRSGIISIMISFIIIKYKYLKSKLTCNKSFILLILTLIVAYVLYIIKKDSANGRLLIWNICLGMILDKPLTGFGIDGFDSSYMCYQANYFKHHPNSVFSQLADNTTTPFNEFIHTFIIFGCIGFIIFTTAIFIIFTLIKKYHVMNEKILYCLVLSFTIWCLSYNPLHEPFIWVIIYFIITIILSYITKIKKKTVIIVLIFIISYIVISVNTFSVKFRWHIVREESLKGNTLENIPVYENLLLSLYSDGDFLYNYGAELHYIGEYEKSNIILKLCEKRLNDYNVQMLIADNYLHLKKWNSALKRFKYANLMIPNRFLPLYYQMIIYEDKKDTIKALSIASKILIKKLKVKDSNVVMKIKEEARACINRHKKY